MILRSNLPIDALRHCLTPGGSLHFDPKCREGRGERESRGSRGGRGFTLVEMLIVIGVMLVLSALTMMVIGSANRASEMRQTKNVLRILEMAVSEWELIADRKIYYGKPDEPVDDASYEINQQHIEKTGSAIQDFHFDDSIFELLGIIERTSQARDILADIDPEFLSDGTDADDIVRLGLGDPWDRTIRAIFPGRTYVDSFDGDGNFYALDEDGSIRTDLELVHGIAVSRQILFVSAGPDGKWGNLHLETAIKDLTQSERDALDEAADNIYSYEPLRKRPAP